MTDKKRRQFYVHRDKEPACQCRKVKSESEVAQSCPTLSEPWTAAHQAPPSMGFSRQEYYSGVPLPRQHIKKQGQFCSQRSI